MTRSSRNFKTTFSSTESWQPPKITIKEFKSRLSPPATQKEMGGKNTQGKFTAQSFLLSSCHTATACSSVEFKFLSLFWHQYFFTVLPMRPHHSLFCVSAANHSVLGTCINWHTFLLLLCCVTGCFSECSAVFFYWWKVFVKRSGGQF